MDIEHNQPDSTLRLRECWLPLAQELNDQQGWDDDGPALERLIISAAPALSTIVDMSAARAILLLYHAVAQTGRR